GPGCAKEEGEEAQGQEGGAEEGGEEEGSEEEGSAEEAQGRQAQAGKEGEEGRPEEEESGKAQTGQEEGRQEEGNQAQGCQAQASKEEGQEGEEAIGFPPHGRRRTAMAPKTGDAKVSPVLFGRTSGSLGLLRVWRGLPAMPGGGPHPGRALARQRPRGSGLALAPAFGLLRAHRAGIAHHAQALPRGELAPGAGIPALQILRRDIVAGSNRGERLAFAHAVVEGPAAGHGREHGVLKARRGRVRWRLRRDEQRMTDRHLCPRPDAV